MLPTVVVLAACAQPEEVDVADYTLHLRPVVATNQSPFEGLDQLDLVVQPEVGETVRATLDVTTSGSTSIAEGLPALEGAIVSVEGYDGGEVVTWGRSEPLDAHEGDVESTLLVAWTDAPAWLGPLATPAYEAALAPLGDGHFLLAGGVGAGTGDTLSEPVEAVLTLTLAPAESTLAFETIGTLPGYADAWDGDVRSARAGASLTPVPSGPYAGQLLLAGGSSGPGRTTGHDVTDDAQLYDPVAGTWTALGKGDRLGVPRTEHLATVNTQGAIVVAGGWTVAADDAFAWTPSIEVWDPATGGFSPTQTDTRLGSLDLVSADLGLDGTLVCGGASFDAGDGRWTSTEHCAKVGLDGLATDGPDLPAPLTGSAMLSLPDGRVLLTGGVTQESRAALDAFPGPSARNSAWVYVGQGTWQSVSPMALPRAGHRMALLPDGRVLVAGGAPTYSPVRVPYDAYSCIEVFDPSSNTFQLVDDCSVSDAAVGLAGRAWKPSLVTDAEFGVLAVGGASASATGEEAASQVTLYTPEHSP